MELLDALLNCRAVLFAKGYFHAFGKFAAVHATYGYTTHIARIVERSDKHLSIALNLFGGRDIFDYGIEHSIDVIGGFLPILAHPSLLSRTVDGGEVELFLGGVEVEHKVENHFLHLIGAAVGLVHLINNNYRFQTYLYCLLEHEASLRHRAFESVDEQETTVSHIEYAFHFTAEVAVARGVDYVDFIAVVVDRNILRKNSNTTLSFKVVIIENQIACSLVFAEQISCEKHLVYQSGFAMVHVGNNGNIPNFLHKLSYFGHKVSDFT